MAVHEHAAWPAHCMHPASRAYLKMFWQAFKKRHSIVYSGSPNRPAQMTSGGRMLTVHDGKQGDTRRSAGGSSSKACNASSRVHYSPSGRKAAAHRCGLGRMLGTWRAAQEAPAGSLQA